MTTVTTHNIYTGIEIKREVLQINKKSIVLAFPEYRTGRETFYFRPTTNKYYAEYAKESFYLKDLS